MVQVLVGHSTTCGTVPLAGTSVWGQSVMGAIETSEQRRDVT